MKISTFQSLLPILVLTAVAHGDSQSELTERELNRTLDYRSDNVPSSRRPVREFYQNPTVRPFLERALGIYANIRNIYGDDNLRKQFFTREEPSATSSFNLRSLTIYEGRGLISVGLNGGHRITFSRLTGAVWSTTFTPVVREADPPLTRERIQELVTEFAEVIDAKLPELEYDFTMIPHPGGSEFAVSYVGCLPGTKFAVGPGVSGNFDRRTGVPAHVSVSREIIPHERPFRPLITLDEAYSLATSLVYDQVPWSAYRVTPTRPEFSIPDYKEEQITRTPRHISLAASKTRCLVTNVFVSPITESATLSKYFLVTIDSNTHEVLKVKYHDLAFGGGDASPLQVAVKDNVMFSLPRQNLKIPVIGVPNPVASQKANLRRVAVRQGDVLFAVDLDRTEHLLWIEGKAYRSTRAFTASLEKAFPPKEPSGK